MANPFRDFGPHPVHGRWLPGTQFALVTYKCKGCGRRVVDEPIAYPPSSGGPGPAGAFWPVCYECVKAGRGPTYDQVMERCREIYNSPRWSAAVVATATGPMAQPFQQTENKKWRAIYDYLGTHEERITQEEYEAIMSPDGDTLEDPDDFFFKYKEYSERMAAIRHRYIATKEDMQRHNEQHE